MRTMTVTLNQGTKADPDLIQIEVSLDLSNLETWLTCLKQSLHATGKFNPDLESKFAAISGAIDSGSNMKIEVKTINVVTLPEKPKIAE